MTALSSDFYNKSYFLGTSPNRGAFSLMELGPKFIDRAQTVADYFNLESAGPIKIAEVGCGTAPFYRLIRQHPELDHLEILCADISDQGIQLLPKANRPPLITASAEDLPFKNESLSGVVSWDVLEHLDHPAKALAEVHRVLLPGGFLHIVCPNPESERETYRRDASHVFPAITTIAFFNETLNQLGFSFDLFTRGFPGSDLQKQTGLASMKPASVDPTGTHLVIFARKL